MNKCAWRVGKSTEDGHKIHIYLWIGGLADLAVSDKYQWHGDLARAFDLGEEYANDANGLLRGLVMLYPESKTGDVFMYEDAGHSDADFIPNSIWKELKTKFKGYELEEKRGMSDAVSRGQAFNIGVPTPMPVMARWSNPLLQYKHAGVTDTEELDAYDSELTRDLMALHDEVNLHPSRDFDSKNERSVQRYYNYTLRTARSRLVPAIVDAAKHSKRQKDIEELLEDAEGKFQMAEHHGENGRYLKTTSFLEDGLSYLHDAIDIIRQTTREVPVVRTYRPITQQQPAWGVR